jgi:hypothetical protein
MAAAIAQSRDLLDGAKDDETAVIVLAAVRSIIQDDNRTLFVIAADLLMFLFEYVQAWYLRNFSGFTLSDAG